MSQHLPILRSVEAIGRGHSVDEGVWSIAGQILGFLQAANDGYAAEHAIKQHAGIKTGAVTVNHSANCVGLTVTNQPVGCFAVESSEMTFAVNNGRWAHGWDQPVRSDGIQVNDLSCKCQKSQTTPAAQSWRLGGVGASTLGGIVLRRGSANPDALAMQHKPFSDPKKARELGKLWTPQPIRTAMVLCSQVSTTLMDGKALLTGGCHGA